MAKFTTVVIALAAAITGANAQIKACNAGEDYCGWGLTNSELGYTHTQLEDAAREAGQDWRNGSILYNTIYKCLDEGAIVWDTHCANGCNPPIPQEGKDFYHCR